MSGDQAIRSTGNTAQHELNPNSLHTVLSKKPQSGVNDALEIATQQSSNTARENIWAECCSFRRPALRQRIVAIVQPAIGPADAAMDLHHSFHIPVCDTIAFCDYQSCFSF